MILGVIAVLFYDAERLDTDSSIKNIGDAFWYLIKWRLVQAQEENKIQNISRRSPLPITDEPARPTLSAVR